MKSLLVACAFAASVVASPALADVISFSHTTPTATGPYTDTFNLPAFTTTLGTLVSIKIDLASSANAEVDVFNNTSSAKSFSNATATVPATATGPAGVSTSQNLVAGPVGGTAPVGFSSYPGLVASASSFIFVPVGDFSSYEAPPAGLDLAFTVTIGEGTYTGTAPTRVFFSGSADVGGVTTITYTYSLPPYSPPVPEPASLALLGTGVLGLWQVCRRRSQ